jgi:pyrroline-5-carboxylate reductase
MENISLGFIGGGRITKILLQGFRNKSVNFQSIRIFDPNFKTLNELKQQFPEIEPVDSPEIPARQMLVVLAIHPPVMPDMLESIKSSVNENTILLSLAPKINIDKILSLLPTRKIIRMIPNATSYINDGLNPVTYHDSFSSEEKNQLQEMFEVLGSTFEVNEGKLESYAIVSAMLPTYFWFQWKKMAEIGVKTGLSEEEARVTICETLQKSINLYYHSGLSTEEIIDLIPVKPIGDFEDEINSIYESKLMGLYKKIKP